MMIQTIAEDSMIHEAKEIVSAIEPEEPDYLAIAGQTLSKELPQDEVDAKFKEQLENYVKKVWINFNRQL